MSIRNILESKDLSLQVQLLLRESAHGTASSTVSSGIIDSDAVISSELLTFKNIEELQQKNKELLRVIRQLSEDREKETQLQHDRRLEEALKELEELKTSRAKQAEMVLPFH
jgi:nucleoprotein TPR